MIGQVMALLAQANTLVSRLTSTRATNLDFLDASIAGITAIRTIQHGTIALNTTTLTNTATVSAVTVAKSVLIPLGTQRNSVASTDGSADVRLSLTNTTTVTADRSETGGLTTTGFVLVEFK